MLAVENTGLLVVDIQGKLARQCDLVEPFIAQSIKLIRAARALSLPIVWLEQNPQGLGGTLEEIAVELTGYTVIEKHHFNACETPALQHELASHRRQHWLVCGIEAHICVYQTCRGLLARGMSVELVTDCIASRNIHDKEVAVNRLGSLGANLTTFEMCLYELLCSSRSPHFRAALDIVKS